MKFIIDSSMEILLMAYMVQRAVALASSTVLVFDHLLTFGDEIEYIWKKKMTPFSVLFLFNRYLAPLMILTYVVLNFSGACESFSLPFKFCFLKGQKFAAEAQVVLLAFTITTMLVAEAMITLRVYAVYQNSKLILWLLFPIFVAHALLMGIMFWLSAPYNIGLHELPILDFSPSAGVMFIAPAVVFDTIAGGLLTLGLYQKSGASQTHMPLVKLIIQDGLLYFTVVFLSNIAWILLHIFGSGWVDIDFGESMIFLEFVPLEIWSGCITTTMIGRLTLNLRMYDPAANNELTFQTMTLRFRQSHQQTSVITSHQLQESNEEGP